MKNSYITIEKRTKKEQKAYHAKQRLSWEGVKPATVVFGEKKYSRKQKHKERYV